MQIGIASLSASPLFIKHGAKIFDGEERAQETLQAYDNLVCNIPKLFYVINKDSDGTAIHYAKMTVGLLQQFRCMMQACIDADCTMADLWKKKACTKHCTPCNYRSMFCETSKAVCRWLPSYTQGMTERSKAVSVMNDSCCHHGSMMLEVDSLLEKKVLADTQPLPVRLYD